MQIVACCLALAWLWQTLGQEDLSTATDCRCWAAQGQCASKMDFMLERCVASCAREKARGSNCEEARSLQLQLQAVQQRKEQLASRKRRWENRTDAIAKKEKEDVAAVTQCRCWAAQDQCAENPDFMLHNCAASCAHEKFCGQAVSLRSQLKEEKEELKQLKTQIKAEFEKTKAASDKREADLAKQEAAKKGKELQLRSQQLEEKERLKQSQIQIKVAEEESQTALVEQEKTAKKLKDLEAALAKQKVTEEERQTALVASGKNCQETERPRSSLGQERSRLSRRSRTRKESPS